jgi:hypothetical protein
VLGKRRTEGLHPRRVSVTDKLKGVMSFRHE